MNRIWLTRNFVAPMAILAIGLGLSPTVVLSHNSDLARHRLDSRAGVAAFKFGYMPGFNPRPAGTVTIFGDGIVESKGRTTQPTRSHLSASALNRLLLFADKAGFFRLPAHIRGEEPMPDRSAAFISIHTVTQDRTVIKDTDARNATFDRVFAKLNSAASPGH